MREVAAGFVRHLSLDQRSHAGSNIAGSGAPRPGNRLRSRQPDAIGNCLKFGQKGMQANSERRQANRMASLEQPAADLSFETAHAR